MHGKAQPVGGDKNYQCITGSAENAIIQRFFVVAS